MRFVFIAGEKTVHSVTILSSTNQPTEQWGGEGCATDVLLDSTGALRPAVAATRLGATDVVETSVSTVELLAALNAALERSSYRPVTAGHLTNHAATRWARAVVAVVEAESDPRTLSGWAAYVGMSVGALRNCRDM